MAFNITGGITLSSVIPRDPPPIPTNPEVNRDSELQATITWDYEADLTAPQAGFRIEGKLSSDSVWMDVGTAPSTSTSFMVTDIGTYTEDFDFRIVAVGSAVGNRALDSNPSDEVTLDYIEPNQPFNVTVESLNNNADRCIISWDFIVTDTQISHFEINCLQVDGDEVLANARATAATTIDDTWREVGTVNYRRGDTGTVSYEFMNAGYSLEDDYQFYRVRAVGDGGFSPWSDDFTDPFIPQVPTRVDDLAFRKVSVDLGELYWTYDGDPVKTFVVKASQTGSDFSTLATVDGSAVPNDNDEYTLDIQGIATESDSIQYKIFTVGLNNITSEQSNIVTVTPEAPRAPTDFTAVVNAGVGVVSSISLSWTRPSSEPTSGDDRFTTVTNGFVLEYKRTGATQWIQIGTYAPDISNTEILPPQQGAIDLRLSTVGANGLTSPVNPTVSLLVTPGAATDDAIYNGDGAFISNDHYSVNSDDIYLRHDPGVTPRVGLLNTIEGGSLTAPTQSNPGRVSGRTGEDLVIEWQINVSPSDVTNQRHYYLNLENIRFFNDPTRVWDVDTGNVIIEVISNPTITNRFYETAAGGFMYFGEDGMLNDVADVRFHDDRVTGAGGLNEPMYVSREQIRLSMRRSFTFRSPGLTTLRITFLADSAGAPFITLPARGDTTNAGALSLEAYASEIIESGTFTVTGLQSTLPIDHTITFEKDFEAIPMVVACPDQPVIYWIDSVSATEATIHVVSQQIGSMTLPTSVNFTYTVRGY